MKQGRAIVIIALLSMIWKHLSTVEAYHPASDTSETKANLPAPKLEPGFAVAYQFPVLKRPYLGQKLLGRTPEIFAPGIVST